METLKEIVMSIAVAFVPVLVIYICRAANNLAEKALAYIKATYGDDATTRTEIPGDVCENVSGDYAFWDIHSGGADFR